MLSNFTIRNNKIVLKNNGEYFGALKDFEYPIGDKLYEFAIMDFKNFDKLKDYYTQLIDLVCTSKECNFQDERFEEISEDKYTVETCLYNWTQEIEKVSKKKHKEYVEYFYTIRDLLINNFMEKKSDLKRRLELISKYSNNSLVRNLSTEDRIYLYETKRVFDLYYVNTKPSHSVFLDTKFTSKYIYDTELSIQEKRLDVEDIFKLIQNNFTINKCENCGRLFIPATTSNNPYQKGRNDQKYCNGLFENTGKTCKEIGALNKQKEKVAKSPILIEYNREYKRMHGLHYNHQKKFTEKKFKEWSKKLENQEITFPIIN